MPLLDMPLDQLRTYAGRNPKPDDFDAFWDRTLAELGGIAPDVELRPADFQTPNAECFDLYFTGLGGARVHAKLLVPRTPAARPHPAMVHFHGYTMRSSDWSDYLGWVGLGFTVAALDCRGQAGRSQDTVVTTGPTQSGHIIRGLSDGPDHLYYRHVFTDCARLAQLVIDRPEVDGTQVIATGGSQGGALAMVCAALEPRVAKCAPLHPFLSDYQRVWEMDLDVHAYDELRRYFRHFDPTHAREAEIFYRLGYIDIQHLAPRIEARLLMGLGLMDNITPPSTCFAAYNRVRSEKEIVIYPDFGHEGLPGFSDRIFQFALS
ncbi:MAG: alpha/beta fold hydrolase [Fimbriimonadaceae bacterium]|nr:alpha/beta fold hydrolase [Fimbriimonadaceae bacterium]